MCVSKDQPLCSATYQFQRFPVAEDWSGQGLGNPSQCTCNAVPAAILKGSSLAQSTAAENASNACLMNRFNHRLLWQLSQHASMLFACQPQLLWISCP